MWGHAILRILTGLRGRIVRQAEGILGLAKRFVSVWDWSWWRVALPLLIFVVFNVYITTGFLSLSVASVRQRPQEEESYLLRTHMDTAH